ncbi:hypothetical protein Slin15195_G127410 [Septoria linicola]|uniref:Uncharacterized protein n=1 Tax=Septoria linicola TaxID=215465 RepID=A0A9Q9B0G0_9PEZI|nr:hypothetical protein Slin15195_G127410 [Septoria linicola]
MGKTPSLLVSTAYGMEQVIRHNVFGHDTVYDPHGSRDSLRSSMSALRGDLGSFFGVRLDYVRKVSFRWIRYEVQLDATDQIVQNLDHDSNIVENSLAARLTWYLHDDCIVSVSDYARVTYTMYQYVPTGPGAGAGAVIPFSAGYILRSLSTSTSLQCVQVRGETRRQIEAAGNNLRLFWRRQ